MQRPIDYFYRVEHRHAIGAWAFDCDNHCMSRIQTVLILLLAATLEAGGDAIVRYGLHRTSPLARMAVFLVGAAVLFAYGFTVNSPPWDFGRLLGLYVVFFFVIAQLLSCMLFRQVPSPALVAGGALIVLGGSVIAVWQ